MAVPEGFDATRRSERVGATQAQADLFAREYSGLRALILRHVRDPELAADILQDAVVTTLQKLHNGEIDRPERAGGYVYRVALNHLRNHRRKDRSSVMGSDGLEEVEDTSAPAAIEAASGLHWAQLVAQVLGELSTRRDRELLVRFYLEEEDKDSICRALGLSEAHFHRVIFRARTRFRELIERKGYRKVDLLSIAVLSLCGIGSAVSATSVIHRPTQEGIVDGVRAVDASMITGGSS